MTESLLKSGRNQLLKLGLIGLLTCGARGAIAAPATNVTMNPVTNNASITWNWADQFSLEASAVKGVISTNNPKQWYDSGENVILTNTPNANCRFIRWFGDVPSGSESNNPLTVTMNIGRGVTASNVQTYSITVSGYSGTDPSIYNPTSGVYSVDEGSSFSGFVINSNPISTGARSRKVYTGPTVSGHSYTSN